MRTCWALERLLEPLARTFFRHMRPDDDTAEDEDEDTPLRTRPDEAAGGATRSPDAERLSAAARPPLSSFLSRLSSAGIGPSAARRRRDASSPRRSTGPRRVSRWPPDATTPLHLSQSTCRGRSLMEFMMDVASSQRYRRLGRLILRGSG